MDSPLLGPMTVDPSKVDRLNVDPTQVIEHIVVRAPLGLRFWDAVSGKVIGDGLIVTTYPEANPHHRVRGFSNPSSVYVLRDLPGLREFEIGNRDETFLDASQPKLPFIIEVKDTENRFLPFLLRANVPIRGLFRWEDPFGGSPPTKAVGVPLYSSPSRPVPAGMAVIRAELRDSQLGPEPTRQPAAWAVIEARMNRRFLARGIADDQGRIALIFPYPEPLMNLLVSPPAAIRVPLQEQEWTIELEAAYIRHSGERPIPPASPIPELSKILSQPPATLWADSQQARPLREVKLKFGRESIVRSRDFAQDPIEGVPAPVLFITPAGSPP